MSQQEQEFPVLQDANGQIPGNNEIYTPRPYNRSESNDGPKDEHPSTFEDSIPPYSYQAQSSTFNDQQASVEGVGREGPRPQDGGGSEQRYRPSYNQYNPQWQVPSWARPQRHKGNKVVRWIVLIVLALLLIKPIVFLATIVLGALALILGAVVLALLLPILILLGILLTFAVMTLIVIRMLGIPIRPSHFRLRSRRYWRR